MIKTRAVTICAREIDGKPYYGLQWVDEEKLELREGYNSFNYNYVCDWLRTGFEIILTSDIDKYN